MRASEKKAKGFTLIEILVVVAIMVAIATVSVLDLSGSKSTADLTDTIQSVAAVLRQAQSDSMTEKNGAQWGVHFDNATATDEFYELFYTTSTYAAGTMDSRYALPADVCFDPASVPAGSSVDVIFSTLSGAPAASATITLDLVAPIGCANGTAVSSSAVSIGSTGAVTY